MTESVLAISVVEIVSQAFQHGEEIAHKCFRVKNLQADEVVAVASIWRTKSLEPALASVRLVVAENVGGRIPDEYVAEHDKSITYYRNNNSGGLVYLETRVQSDEQGLQNLFTLRDSNFLDGSFDEYAGIETGVPGLIIKNAWISSVGSNVRVPSLLMDRTLLAIRLVHPDVNPVPVRKFIEFAVDICNEWNAHGTAIDSEKADRIVGGCMSRLDMFPDALWRRYPIESRIRRRFELNARHAELISSGAELDAEELQRSASTTQFMGELGEPLSRDQIKLFGDLCCEYVSTLSADVRRQIPYAIFEQLFKRDTVGLKLGDRVRSEVDQSNVSRTAELEAAEVLAGLNARSQTDAARFLALTAPEGLQPIRDLLTDRTRKAVERLAAPPLKGFFNPAIELVRMQQRLLNQTDGVQLSRIEISIGKPLDSSNSSVGLFAFLFGPTLKAISEGVRGVPGACELVVARELVSQQPIPALEDDRDSEDSDDGRNDEESGPVKWDPLPIRIRAYGADGRILEESDDLKWEPIQISHFALLWLLVADGDSPIWNNFGGVSFNDLPETGNWTAPFVQRLLPLSAIKKTENAIGRGGDQIINDLLTLREALRDSLRLDGLSPESINAYFDEWQILLERIRVMYVPDGSRPPVLQAFLSNDTIFIKESGRRLMLPLQPIRLRWVARYLDRCIRLATECLEGQTGFATDDGSQYLDWLEGLSPHESPPTASGESGQTLFARSEVAWFEEFAALEGVKADVSVDHQALEAIASRVRAYLEAHPYKRDGLAILLLLPPSNDMAAELIRRIVRGPLSDLRISISVAVPKFRWEPIARLVETLPAEVRGTLKGRLFPARDLKFIDYSPGDSLAEQMDGPSFDIAIVTHLLQESVISQQNTEPIIERAGAFDPLTDRPIRLESGNNGSTSIVMRPRDPDQALETWGTLVVRSNRNRPVSPSQPENTDFIELLVNFQDSARVFNVLHQCSHWVVTLEKHISREQIESEEAGAPDVLSIETDVGSNGLSTLIVSSRSGRELIVSRLSKKLRKLLPQDLEASAAIRKSSELAARIYDETRKLSPHLALQALGVARVTEEILGLCIARRVAEKEVPDTLSDGISAWISLDEHASWLAGASNIRADMCRISINRNAIGRLEVDVLVLEGKLRQSFDSHGKAQTERTCDFFEAILSTQVGEQKAHVDSEMWRERILSAMENVSKEARRVVGSASRAVEQSGSPISNEIRQQFREGKYTLKTVQGVYSACLWEANDEQIIRDQQGRLCVVRSTRAHIFDLIGATPTLDELSSGERPERVDSSYVRPPIHVEQNQNGSIEGVGSAKQNPIGSVSNPIAEVPVSDSPREVPGLPSVPSEPTPGRTARLGRRRMDKTTLARIYNEVLACFASHNISVTAAAPDEEPYAEGPASILFRVRTGVGVDPKKLFEKSQALKLRLELEQEQNVSFDIDRGFVTIDVPKRPDDRYFVDASDMWQVWTRKEAVLSVPIGEDRYGQVVSIDFSSPNTPHLLIAGTTGSGKSEALSTILFGLVRTYTPSELRLLLIDPKGTELVAFADCPYLEGSIGWDDSDTVVLLRNAVEEMQRRYLLFRSAGKRSLAEFNSNASETERIPWWLIVMDEYADLTQDPQSKKEIEHELKRLAQKARAAGIHLIIATQKPSADVISTNLRSNLPAQLALRVKSGTESRVILDESGADTLNGKGDALLKADGKLKRVQCAKVAVKDQVIIGKHRISI